MMRIFRCMPKPRFGRLLPLFRCDGQVAASLLDLLLRHVYGLFPAGRRYGRVSSFSRRSAARFLNRENLPGSGVIVTKHRFSYAIGLLGFLVLGGSNAFAMPSPLDAAPSRLAVDARSGATRLAQAQPAQRPADEPIGNVATLTGSATVTRNNAATQLKLQDDVFLNDVLQTSANSTLGVTFNDATTFNLTANAQITVDNFVYEDGGKQNGALFDIAKGTVAFVAASVAKTGDMRISTPTASLGIRGTTGLVEVPQ